MGQGLELFKNASVFVYLKECLILSKFMRGRCRWSVTSSFYFGEYYKQLGRYGKAYNYYVKAIKELKDFDKDKVDFIDDYLSQQYQFIDM